MRVVNVNVERCDVYIGRQMPGYTASPLGNPHKVVTKREPEKVCPKCGAIHRTAGETLPLYREWLRKQWAKGPNNPTRWQLEHIARLVMAGHDVKLGCWCHPGPCHGDVVMEVVNAIIAKRTATT